MLRRSNEEELKDLKGCGNRIRCFDSANAPLNMTRWRALPTPNKKQRGRPKINFGRPRHINALYYYKAPVYTPL